MSEYFTTSGGGLGSIGGNAMPAAESYPGGGGRLIGRRFGFSGAERADEILKGYSVLCPECGAALNSRTWDLINKETKRFT
jgi:hypothetical protein